MKYIIAYVPVLHAGYLEFFKKYSDAKVLFLIGEDILRAFPELDYVCRKDALRALPPEEMARAIRALSFSLRVEVIYLKDISRVKTEVDVIIFPDEDVTRLVAGAHFGGKKILFDSIFLRWHRGNVEKEQGIQPSRRIAVTDFDKECIASALREGEKSADWWRQVGGIIVKDGRMLLWGHNSHVPFPEMPYVFGDPRSIFKSGIRIELSTASHVERALVAEAVNRGISFRGADIYITDFPCPPCALAIAPTGIRRLYYAKGSYSMLNGESVLRSYGIEIVRVVL